MSQVIITEIYLESTRRLLPSLKLGDSGDVDGVLTDFLRRLLPSLKLGDSGDVDGVLTDFLRRLLPSLKLGDSGDVDGVLTDFLSRGRQLKRQIYLLSAKSCTFTA